MAKTVKAMSYNRALDLMAAAIVALNKQQPNRAAKSLQAAAKDPSVTSALKIIEASNSKAYKARQLKAGVDDLGVPDVEPGEEFRVEVDDQDARTVQEATALEARARKMLAKAKQLRADAVTADGDEDDDGDMDFLDDDSEDIEADADGDLDESEMECAATTAVAASPIKSFATRAGKTVATANTSKAFAQTLRNLNAIGK